MAAAMASMALSTPSTAISRDFQALKFNNVIRLNTPSLAPVRSRGGVLAARCDYLGSPTNLIMVASTTFLLLAGRFGLAPSTNRRASAGLKLSDNESGLQTGDPAGFTGTDTLAFGAMGHIIGVGVVLGLKAVGSI